MGKITGSDPKLSPEVILLTSHLDHLGVRENAPGDDKIFNGADDDASGTVAVLELARVLGSGVKPKRTVYFVCFGSEEAGGYGASYFVNNMPFPKEKLVANLEFEMIGRPDAKVKPDELWLTGYERSNLGPELAKRGAKLVQDPHPEQNFFQRSDNIQLARAGIIAHTVSSYGLHTDYHHASDEIKTIDFVHMTQGDQLDGDACQMACKFDVHTDVESGHEAVRYLTQKCTKAAKWADRTISRLSLFFWSC